MMKSEFHKFDTGAGLSHTRHNYVEASSCPSTCRKQRPYAEEVALRSEAG